MQFFSLYILAHFYFVLLIFVYLCVIWSQSLVNPLRLIGIDIPFIPTTIPVLVFPWFPFNDACFWWSGDQQCLRYAIIPTNTSMTNMIDMLPSKIINHGSEANADEEYFESRSPNKNDNRRIHYKYKSRCIIVQINFHLLNFIIQCTWERWFRKSYQSRVHFKCDWRREWTKSNFSKRYCTDSVLMVETQVS